MDQIQTSPAPPMSTLPVAQLLEPKSKIWLWVLGGILLLVTGIAGGVFWGKQLYSTPNIQPTPSPIVEATPTPDPTANWNTYTTQKFSLKYPVDWQIGLFEHAPDIYTFQPSKDFVPESQKNGVVLSITGRCLNTQCLTVFNLEDMVSQINAKIVNQATADRMKAYKVSLPDEKLAYIFINGQDFFEISTDKYITELDQVLSTFKFIDETSADVLPVSSAKKLNYQLPNGWQIIKDNTGTFEVGYDPKSQDGNPNSNLAHVYAVVITDKNLNDMLYYSSLSNSIFLWLLPYSGGSRHTFFETAILKEKLSMHNQDSREREYIVQGKNCLVFYKLRDLSQGHTTIGMCPINNSQALVFSSFFEETTIEAVLQTLKFFK